MPVKNRTIRKEIKKKQRQRRRQKQAQQRDKQLEEDEAEKQKNPEYQKWQKQQLELEKFERLASERQQQDEEEAWLRREALAQRQFQLDAAERRCEEEKINRLRQQQAQELALIKEQQKQRREEKKRMADRAAAEFEAMMKTMDAYLSDTDTLKPPPLELQRLVETHPQERLCEFFTRTNCCRFGHTCTHNHRRPMLAKILLIRHFFSHPLLKQSSSDDYLELTEHDLRDSYDEFFHDAVAELEKFGKIVNFRALRNTLDYLRGHVFVEYAQERHALKAFINLQGRYYASRQLNVEFSNIKGWRGAVCGT
ncbi:U2 small nuclear ribonucleoprotein auxiliary factor 35 kDa subunit-related protein 2 isoform X2 [Drosophila tropicalis]|uniref:U2 small nuclear ribonucleoprotein auxiliary factor 35 kDa subunit-related protein 2 isoform X2 n=1 Tax=Drosophila tropicalis TaxID=46794 RepID=UPI0035ABF041